MVLINLHVGKDMDSGHYVCDVLDYKIGAWWRCDNDIITNFLEYPENVYNKLS